MRLDAHQHFWQYNPAEHVWMTARMAALKRNFLPAHLEPLLTASGFDGTIAVQARQNLEETRWLLELAERNQFIKGVVGWVDLRSPALRVQLQQFSAHPKLAGVRHVVHDEPDEEFLLRPEFRRGIAQLREFDLTYDLLLYPKHLKIACQFVAEFPQQTFVLDHIAKPEIAQARTAPWETHLRELAQFPNVFCKLSGMVTEARWGQGRAQDFHPYLDTVVDAFGLQRLMIGSDWPVCTLSAAYPATMGIVIDYLQQFSAADRAAVLGDNCARIYRIHSRPPITGEAK